MPYAFRGSGEVKISVILNENFLQKVIGLAMQAGNYPFHTDNLASLPMPPFDVKVAYRDDMVCRVVDVAIFHIHSKGGSSTLRCRDDLRQVLY